MSTRGATPAERQSERVRLKVLYDFEYETRGKRVRIIKDEKLLLLKKTNEDWWQVVRPVDCNNFYVPEQSTFFVPTGYVIELQETQLPESTRFYVDKDKMFKSTETCQQEKGQQDASTKEEPRKVHESFRNVIKRKLSGNLGSSNDPNKAAKPVKPSKIIKNLRKNSMDSNEENIKAAANKSSLGIVSAKHKEIWEGSAFGMCFGRDTKNTDAQVLNPFQEELGNALSNRVSLKKNVIDNKLVVNKYMGQVQEEKEESTNFESIHNKWEKVSAQILKKPDSSHFVPLAKIKEDVQKRRSASPNYQITEETNNTSVSPSERGLSDTEKLYSLVLKNPKKQSQIPEPKLDILDKKEETVLQQSPKSDKIKKQDPVDKSDVDDKLLINDKRKMWAIEMLMSELMQSASNSKSVSTTENNDTGISGPNQLAQELHEMTVSRRFENAEIQVNLLDNNDYNTKENDALNDDTKHKMNSWNKKVFDFSPHSNAIKAPKSPTARSPKLLDEYNEANILNDERSKVVQDIPVEVLKYSESPSYSNISLRIKREKLPCQLKMPTKDFREELQLTPSLEKLASEIQFLPASINLVEQEHEKNALDLDCPTTTLSQDSLRLYKRRSKSDGALNKREPRRRDSVASQRPNPTSACSQAEIFRPREHGQPPLERKYAQHHGKFQDVAASATGVHHHQECCGHRASGQASRYKLNRKSRSLGDLDCSEMDERKEDEEEEEEEEEAGACSSYETESRRRYKPVPKLRSKESLRRVVKPAVNPVLTSTVSAERLSNTKPVPAKRRIQPQYHQQQQQQQQHHRHHHRRRQDHRQPSCNSSCDDLTEIDLERSTAIGFKALLRTSDSGSEEYLQYKTFPAASRAQQQLSAYEQQSKLGSAQHHQGISRSDGNVNSLSRSLSDEAILSSASCSSASPSRLLDDSVENLVVSLPAGWTQAYDSTAKRICFVNERGDKWFSSSDVEGKIYFFEENSNESSWALPSVISESRVRTISNGDWPQLFDGNMCILKEGAINKTKITTENGKKLRKAWSMSYAVLTELFLLFFKDAKTFDAMKMDQSAAAKPDISVDLNGAFIESAEKLSNRKNVYLINTMLGLQVLIQSDNSLVIAEWYRGIDDAIQRLPFSQEYGRSSSSRD